MTHGVYIEQSPDFTEPWQTAGGIFAVEGDPLAKSTVEKSSVRLKTVLDVLAEGTWSEKSLNAGEVLAEAIVRVPFDARESELLSGGIPRGHKSLTTATARLVKAGWLNK